MVNHRSATANQLRGLLVEYGIVIPKGIRHLRTQVPEIIEDAEQPLTTVARGFVDRLHKELDAHERQLEEIEAVLATWQPYKAA